MRSRTIARGGGDVDRRREDVVGRLRGVHVVVRVHRLAERLGGQRRDDLVGVHVARRPGAGLEDVDREVLVPRRRGRRSRRPSVMASAISRVEHAEVGVHRGGRALDRGQRADELALDAACRRSGSSRRRAASGPATWPTPGRGPRPWSRARCGSPRRPARRRPAVGPRCAPGGVDGDGAPGGTLDTPGQVPRFRSAAAPMAGASRRVAAGEPTSADGVPRPHRRPLRR